MTTYPTSPLDAIGSAQGAFKVDDGGGEYKYGQDYNESIISQLFHIPTPTLGTAIDLLQQYLLKLPIEALRAFKDLIPGTVDDDFLNVLTAVDTIIDNLQASPAFVTLEKLQVYLMDGIVGTIVLIINTILDIIRSILSFVGMSAIVPPNIVV